MKNLNPYAGIKQISTGYYYSPRGFVVRNCCEKKLNPLNLGYLHIAITSADWDKDPYRFGLIRHDIKTLSIIFGIRYQTLLDNFNKLVKKGYLKKENDVFRVVHFKFFKERGLFEKHYPNNEIKDRLSEILVNSSKKIKPQSDISEYNSSKASNSFNVSFKVGNNLSNKDSYQYTQSEWTKIRLEDPGLPSWEDKLLIDESVSEATPIRSFHQQVKEALY